ERVDVARVGALGVLEVAERGTGGGNGPRSSLDTEALEAGDAEVGPEEGAGPGGIEVRRLALGERERAEGVLHRGPDRGGRVRGGEALAGLVRGHRLEHRLEGRALEGAEVARRCVEERRAVGAVSRAHRDQPGGARGVEDVLVENGSGGDDADDLP